MESPYLHCPIHKSVLMTAECAENYIRTKPGGVKETTMPHRTFFSTKLIPKLDKFILIDDKKYEEFRIDRQVPTTSTVT